MQMSQRMNNLAPYLFVEINKKIAAKKALGEEIINFSIGDPDLPTPENVINKICQKASDPSNHRYPETFGLPELRQAIADWYKKRFNVILNPDTEVLPLHGSKEGIAHIALCYINPGDIALVPDPSYPVYTGGTILAGGEVHYLPLLPDNNFLPDLTALPDEVIKKAKILWINYPNNPTGAVAEMAFFNKVVEFARK